MVLGLNFEAINCEVDTGSWPKDAWSQKDKKMYLGMTKFAGVLE
jgi:hypothetical protein